jgi:hypothetical protein
MGRTTTPKNGLTDIHLTKPSVLLIHLSDIHFAKSPLGPRYELDADLRKRLEADAEYLSQQADIGPPDGILVSGDVAFSGQHEQYDEAANWLADGLCSRVRCDPSNVWCVCGNHDVDQNEIRSKPTYELVRDRLRKCQEPSIERMLHKYLKEPGVFYDPIAAYNKFAGGFGCDVSRERPTWSQSFVLSDGSTIRVHGLNSALISDAKDNKATGKIMVLGEYQCQLDDCPGAVDIAMCHHPPDWLRDADAVEEILNPRTRLQLFGHKHKFKLASIEGGLRLGAGAVHPSRNEPDWQPRYNWLRITIENNGTQRRLHIDVYARLWNREQQKFDADRNMCGGAMSKRVSFDLPPFQANSPAAPVTNSPDALSRGGTSATESQSHDVTDVNGIVIMDPDRTLVRRYFNLPYSKTMKIATDLELIRDGDGTLSDLEQQKLHVQRARDEGRATLAKLWDAVEAAHGDGKYPTNPFSA